MPRAKNTEGVHFAPGTITTPVKKPAQKKKKKATETMDISDDESLRRSGRVPTPRKAKSSSNKPLCAC
jgi:hypothetical protein